MVLNSPAQRCFWFNPGNLTLFVRGRQHIAAAQQNRPPTMPNTPLAVDIFTPLSRMNRRQPIANACQSQGSPASALNSVNSCFPAAQGGSGLPCQWCLLFTVATSLPSGWASSSNLSEKGSDKCHRRGVCGCEISGRKALKPSEKTLQYLLFIDWTDWFG